VEAFARDWRTVPLGRPDQVLFEFADKLTREPWTMTEADIERLRHEGWTDEHISDAVQIIGYFNYINRVADGLGVDLEDVMTPQPGAGRSSEPQPAQGHRAPGRLDGSRRPGVE